MSGLSGRSIAIALSLVMAGVIGVGLWLSGSPATARQKAIDGRRVGDLRDTKAEVHAYWLKHHLLPSAIDSVSSLSPDTTAHRDPVTGTPYEYRVTGDSTYELCAVFTYSSIRDRDVDWRHPAGRHCFPLQADQRY